MSSWENSRWSLAAQQALSDVVPCLEQFGEGDVGSAYHNAVILVERAAYALLWERWCVLTW